VRVCVRALVRRKKGSGGHLLGRCVSLRRVPSAAAGGRPSAARRGRRRPRHLRLHTRSCQGVRVPYLVASSFCCQGPFSSESLCVGICVKESGWWRPPRLRLFAAAGAERGRRWSASAAVGILKPCRSVVCFAKARDGDPPRACSGQMGGRGCHCKILRATDQVHSMNHMYGNSLCAAAPVLARARPPLLSA
jgi:hypothetical protein